MKRITIEMTIEEIESLNEGATIKANYDGLAIYLCGTMFEDHVKKM